MDSPDQYMNIVYKPCGFAERTLSTDDLPHASGDKPTHVTASKG